MGRILQPSFDDRQEADYEAVAEFDEPTVQDRIAKAGEFVAEIQWLIDKRT